MIIDDRGRLFGKINLVDLIFLLVVAVAIAGVGYKFKRTKTVTPFTATGKVYIEFKQDDAPDFAVKGIKAGDSAADFERSNNFGKITDIQVGESRFYGTNANGQFVTSPKEGFNSVTIKVEADGVINAGGGVSIGNVDYFIGRTLQFKAGNSILYGRISDIKKKE